MAQLPNEFTTLSSSEIQQDCQAGYNLFVQQLTAFNNSLARAGLTQLTVSPTLPTTLASILTLPT